MSAQPLRVKIFQLSERLGIPAYELMQRMSMPEILEYIEYDQQYIGESWYQHAQLMTMICRAVGDKKAKPRDFLPKVKKPKRKLANRTVEEIRRDFNASLGIIQV